MFRSIGLRYRRPWILAIAGLFAATAHAAPPIPLADSYSTPADTPLVVAAPGLLENDFDPDGDSLEVTSFIPPANGTVAIQLNGAFTYEPDPGFAGVDTFTYRASDGTEISEETVVTITVYQPNRPPVVVSDAYWTPEGTDLIVTAPGLLANDFDPDGDSFVVASFTPSANGTVAIQLNGSFTYEPDPGFTGTDSFSYQAVDDTEISEVATVTILVLAETASLTLIKDVINDNGGPLDPEDFTLILTGADGIHDDGVQYGHDTMVSILAGVEYTITETTEPDYTLVSISCQDEGASPVGAGGEFSAAQGQDITCTVTNDDLNNATFAVTKNFDDDNPAGVEVTISCNTGLPLEQSTTISEGDGVTFVVTDFEHGTMACTIIETDGAEGYATEYSDSAVTSDQGCIYEGVLLGEENLCEITNTLLPVDIEVTKTWVDDNPQFASPYVSEAAYACANERFGNAGGTLFFNGNPDSESFNVFPHWDGTTTCTVTEDFVEGGVETDDSDCEGLSVAPGSGASCEIVNTRLYEGIPTLNRTNLALLAMLMLALGMVAARRMQ